MTENSDYKAEDNLTRFHTFLIKKSVKAADNLTSLRRTGNKKYQERFKAAVESLTQFYFFKFNKADVEKPETLQDEEVPPDMTSVDLKKCKKVYFKIMEVQDDLGHTTLEKLQRGRREV